MVGCVGNVTEDRTETFFVLAFEIWIREELGHVEVVKRPTVLRFLQQVFCHPLIFAEMHELGPLPALRGLAASGFLVLRRRQVFWFDSDCRL